VRKGEHVCVVDPGVGTERHGLIIETGRGDHLIGPDNGVLIPATRFLGGITRVHRISNPTLMRQPVSMIFHGRDVFAPAAAHLAAGISIEEFGPAIQVADLVPAAYEEAYAEDDTIEARVISINGYGSIFLNIRAEEMHKVCKAGESVTLILEEKTITLPYRQTFGDVPEGQPLILDDDFGRVEVAVNLGSFAEMFGTAIGNHVELRKA
jgi:S-adenosylmethionine hydrolase